MSSASQISEQAVVLAMDYGLFSLSGGLADFEDEFELLAQAQAALPCAGDGKALVVLSPHQNNFEMPIAVQLWDGARPRTGTSGSRFARNNSGSPRPGR